MVDRSDMETVVTPTCSWTESSSVYPQVIECWGPLYLVYPVLDALGITSFEVDGEQHIAVTAGWGLRPDMRRDVLIVARLAVVRSYRGNVSEIPTRGSIVTNVLSKGSNQWKRAVCRANGLMPAGRTRSGSVLVQRWSDHAAWGWSLEAAEEAQPVRATRRYVTEDLLRSTAKAYVEQAARWLVGRCSGSHFK
jgi:hypothetical protein